MFDPEKFGEAMGKAIRAAVDPLVKRIANLEEDCKRLRSETDEEHQEMKALVKSVPAGRDGKDCDMEAVKAMVAEAVKAIPQPNDGKDGAAGVDGSSVTIDDVRPVLDDAIKGIRAEAIQAIETAMKAIPVPKDGRDGRDGVDGKDGQGIPGKDGSDGAGLAGAMIDRDGALQITMTNGEVKNLGMVVGKNGTDGTDGKDGIGLDSFELEYIEETHEVCVKASCAGRTKELRYPAGGIRPAGYWREGVKAKAAEAWVHDGSTWIATKGTSTKPATGEDWIIAARKGRDGERGRDAKAVDNSPIKLGE